MSGVTFQPANWFLWVGFCSLECFCCFSFAFSAQRGTKNNKHRLSLTHTQFCFFVITHNGRLQGPGYQILLFHLLMETAAEQKRMFLKRHWGCFCPLSQTSNVIHGDSQRQRVTLMERNSAVHRNIHVHGWEFQNGPYEILQRCRALWTESPW